MSGFALLVVAVISAVHAVGEPIYNILMTPNERVRIPYQVSGIIGAFTWFIGKHFSMSFVRISLLICISVISLYMFGWGMQEGPDGQADKVIANVFPSMFDDEAHFTIDSTTVPHLVTVQSTFPCPGRTGNLCQMITETHHKDGLVEFPVTSIVTDPLGHIIWKADWNGLELEIFTPLKKSTLYHIAEPYTVTERAKYNAIIFARLTSDDQPSVSKAWMTIRKDQKKSSISVMDGKDWELFAAWINSHYRDLDIVNAACEKEYGSTCL